MVYLSDPGCPWASPTIALSASFISTNRARKNSSSVILQRKVYVQKIFWNNIQSVKHILYIREKRRVCDLCNVMFTICHGDKLIYIYHRKICHFRMLCDVNYQQSLPAVSWCAININQQWVPHCTYPIDLVHCCAVAKTLGCLPRKLRCIDAKWYFSR